MNQFEQAKYNKRLTEVLKENAELKKRVADLEEECDTKRLMIDALDAAVNYSNTSLAEQDLKVASLEVKLTSIKEIVNKF